VPVRIDATSCFELLRTTNEGHVALSVAALPVIVPVRFALVVDDVIFGVSAEPRLIAALDGNVVCLAASSRGVVTSNAWTITVTGTARVLGAEPVADLARPVIDSGPWGADRLVRMRAELVRGRYFGG
jgi:nitroimidazol reductase NimA-like FMN-containing flavoprotein (pyridoxamine 5'-phosphate oxidase superfamily)